VAIARAVTGERRLLLADEPSGALDSANGEAVMQMIRDACARGVAAVLVTHDAQLASWADRVLLVRDGQVSDQAAQAGPGARLGVEPARGPPDCASGRPARREPRPGASRPGAR
jgi:putative ABC transport system ATP-binding protein